MCFFFFPGHLNSISSSLSSRLCHEDEDAHGCQIDNTDIKLLCARQLSSSHSGIPLQRGKETKATWDSSKKPKFDFFFDDEKCFRREHLYATVLLWGNFQKFSQLILFNYVTMRINIFLKFYNLKYKTIFEIFVFYHFLMKICIFYM